MSTTVDPDQKQLEAVKKPKRGFFMRLFRFFIWCFILVIIAGAIARPFLPQAILWYVNRTLNQSPVYQGKVGDIDLHIWRGAYTIRNVRILKTTGNIPVPLFSADKFDLSIDWDAIFHRKIVGRISIDQPEVNFVDSQTTGESETGAGGPWLQIIKNLFPFDINSARLVDGSVHFRTYQNAKPVDVYLSRLNVQVDDLTNVNRSVTPLLTTINVTALAMDQAKLEMKAKLDPFSYNPTFHLDLRLLGLDITKTNDLIETYGKFDVKHGLFDLVLDLDCEEGAMTGYVKPLFRNMVIFDITKDVRIDDPLKVFWQGIVGGTAAILTNYNRDQLATVIPFTGKLPGAQIDLLATVGNVLRNAFIRAYIPRLEAGEPHPEDIDFGPAQLTDPISAGDK